MIINRIINVINNYKLYIENFSYLSIIQILNMIFPIITYPYLIRTVGANNYGLVIYANSIITYFTIVINYGFNIFAVKYVSLFRSNKILLSKITSTVLIIKFFLFIMCIVFFSLLLLSLNKLRMHSLLFSITFLTSISEIVLPIWFFQGLEKMKYITIIYFISSFFYFLTIFFIIKCPTDYIYIPILKFLGILIAGIVSIIIMYKTYKIKFQFPSLNYIKTFFWGSTPFFFSSLATIINSETNTILIGSFLSLIEVSYYDISKKILSLLIIPFTLINQTVYPSIASSKNMLIVKKLIKISLLISSLFYILLLIFGKKLILLLGGQELIPAYSIMLLITLTLPIQSISFFLGNTTLVVMGKSKYFNLSNFYSVIFYLVITITLYIFNKISLFSLVLIFLLFQLFILFYRFYYIKKFQFY